MTIHERDILAYVGGAALKRYGTLSRRVARIGRRGEDVIETFTRSGSVGTCIDRNGVVHRAAANVPRILHWNPHAGAALDPPALILEDARTNLCIDSEDFSAAAWTNTRSTDSTDADVAPDGATTADRLIEDATASDTHYISDTVSTTPIKKVALSVFAKAGTRTWICLAGCNGVNDYVREWFDLANGAVGTYASASGENMAYARSYIEAYGSGWYRCTLVITNGNSAAYAIDEMRVYLATADQTISYSGDGSSYAVLWGAQCEDDAALSSSYIPASGGAATRNVEDLYLDLPLGLHAMSIYAKIVEATVDTVGNPRLIHYGTTGASTDPRWTIYKLATSDQWGINHDNGVTNIDANPAAAPGRGDVVELLANIYADGSIDIEQSLNGAASTSASDATTATLAQWAGQRLYLNGVNGGSVGFEQIVAAILCRDSHSMDDYRALLP